MMSGVTDSPLVSAIPDLCIRDVVPPSDAQYTSEAPLVQSVNTYQISLGWSPTFRCVHTIGRIHPQSLRYNYGKYRLQFYLNLFMPTKISFANLLYEFRVSYVNVSRRFSCELKNNEKPLNGFHFFIEEENPFIKNLYLWTKDTNFYDKVSCGRIKKVWFGQTSC